MAPNFAQGHQTIARLLTFSGDANGAISTLDTYMRLDPLYPELALYFLAEARFSLGQFDEPVLANPRCVLPATPPELSVVVTDSTAPRRFSVFYVCLKTTPTSLRIPLSHITDEGLPSIVHMDVLDTRQLLAALRKRRRTSICIAYALSKRASVNPNAAIRRSVPKPRTNSPRTAMAAMCMQAIWTASALASAPAPSTA